MSLIAALDSSEGDLIAFRAALASYLAGVFGVPTLFAVPKTETLRSERFRVHCSHLGVDPEPLLEAASLLVEEDQRRSVPLPRRGLELWEILDWLEERIARGVIPIWPGPEAALLMILAGISSLPGEGA